MGTDYLQDFKDWLDVQNGADVRCTEHYGEGFRFIASPRDLATYVHYDALYEAYLNACLILLGLRAPFDPGLPFLAPDHIDKQLGFAQFGGPHILTLVTEVATRALKAVRYQKYNVHRRLRPEALGGWMYQRRNGDADVKARLAALESMEAAYEGSSGIGAALEAKNGTDNWLLPMAFPEGSPTHPSYGAGHATVAGACVTILKAWFDHGWQLRDGDGATIGYQPNSDGSALVDVGLAAPLTVEGELNKIAANIAIGRDWAGVHYYTDYYESFRLGEQVAIGMLEEQKLTYGENFSMTVPLFDGTTVRI
ncbi:MAG: vanadium-dependent haloperoxidase [Pseudonocardiaceae bacterium]